MEANPEQSLAPILVVDGNAVNRTALSSMLSEFDNPIQELESGEAAIEYLTTQPAAVAIIDSGLLDMGLGKLFSGAGLDQCPEIVAQNFACLGKGVFDQVRRIGKFCEHAYFLGALPRKDKACVAGLH